MGGGVRLTAWRNRWMAVAAAAMGVGGITMGDGDGGGMIAVGDGIGGGGAMEGEMAARSQCAA